MPFLALLCLAVRGGKKGNMQLHKYPAEFIFNCLFLLQTQLCQKFQFNSSGSKKTKTTEEAGRSFISPLGARVCHCFKGAWPRGPSRSAATRLEQASLEHLLSLDASLRCVLFIFTPEYFNRRVNWKYVFFFEHMMLCCGRSRRWCGVSIRLGTFSFSSVFQFFLAPNQIA